MDRKYKQYSFLLLIFALAGFFAIRLATPEDNWFCQDGIWVKHGNPSTPQPSQSCPGAPSPTLAPTPSPLPVVLFFSNSRRARGSSDCSLVFGVERPVSVIDAGALLTELFTGPSSSERSQGYSSPFSSKTKNILKSVKIIDSTAYVNFIDIRPLIPNASSSCGSAQFLSQIEETLKQNSSIREFRYAIDGNPEAFYDWIQIGCDQTINNCDPAPFN